MNEWLDKHNNLTAFQQELLETSFPPLQLVPWSSASQGPPGCSILKSLLSPVGTPPTHLKVCLSTSLWGRPVTWKKLRRISIRHNPPTPPKKGNQNLRISTRVWRSINYDQTCPCREGILQTDSPKKFQVRKTAEISIKRAFWNNLQVNYSGYFLWEGKLF